ncbi:MAG: VRR-NUC domain-containing protein [Candidatus Thioglobus sp.]|jgi:hypothetical protein
MRETERQVQVAIAQYLDVRGLMWYAVPNGGNRNLITAKKLQAEGVKAGVPDIALIYEGQAYFLEVKKPKTDTRAGVLSITQKAMIERIEQAGGEVGIVHSVQEVIEQLIIWGINR